MAWLAAGAQQDPALGSVIAELRQHRSAEALRDASRALEAQPGNARLWVLKGVAAQQTGQLALAQAAFESALQLEPDSLPALEGASEIAFRSGSPNAEKWTAELLKRQPDNAVAHGIAGMLAFRKRQWSQAAEHFEKAGPALAAQKSALQAQAIALDHVGRQADAEAVLHRVLEAWPADSDARYDLAALQLRAKQESAAVETLQPLLQAHEEDALAMAADAVESQGDTPQAVALLRQAIESHPENEQNYLQFAALSFDHSSFAAGIAMLTYGLKQLPSAASLYVARGALRMQMSQVAQAEQDFATADRLDPSQSFGFEAQGLDEIQRHNLPAALSKVQASLRLSAGDAYLHYLAAEILKEQGAAPGSSQAKEAIGYATAALTLDPHLVAARNLLAALEFEAGEYAEAAKQSRAVLRQNPMNAEAIYRLILALRRSQDAAGSHADEIDGLVARLKQARAGEHENQVRIDKYRLSVAAAEAP